LRQAPSVWIANDVTTDSFGSWKCRSSAIGSDGERAASSRVTVKTASSGPISWNATWCRVSCVLASARSGLSSAAAAARIAQRTNISSYSRPAVHLTGTAGRSKRREVAATTWWPDVF